MKYRFQIMLFTMVLILTMSLIPACASSPPGNGLIPSPEPASDNETVPNNQTEPSPESAAQHDARSFG